MQGPTLGGGVPHAEVAVDLLVMGIAVVMHTLVVRDQRMEGLDIYQELQRPKHGPLGYSDIKLYGSGSGTIDADTLYRVREV